MRVGVRARLCIRVSAHASETHRPDQGCTPPPIPMHHLPRCRARWEPKPAPTPRRPTGCCGSRRRWAACSRRCGRRWTSARHWRRAASGRCGTSPPRWTSTSAWRCVLDVGPDWGGGRGTGDDSVVGGLHCRFFLERRKYTSLRGSKVKPSRNTSGHIFILRCCTNNVWAPANVHRRTHTHTRAHTLTLTFILLAVTPQAGSRASTQAQANICSLQVKRRTEADRGIQQVFEGRLKEIAERIEAAYAAKLDDMKLSIDVLTKACSSNGPEIAFAAGFASL